LAWSMIIDEDNHKESKVMGGDKDDDDDDASNFHLRDYWSSVRSRHCSITVLDDSTTPSQIDTQTATAS